MLRLMVALALLVSAPCLAQDYPNKLVRIVVPTPAGASTDLVARIISERMGSELGQPLIVDNKSGGGGMVGIESVARLPPDGYSVLLSSTGAFVIAPNLYRNSAPFNPLKDFVSIGMIARVPVFFAANPRAGFKSVADVIKAVKAAPGTIYFASGGNGILPHLMGMQLRLAADLDMVHVPYRGEGAATNDAVAGQVGLIFAGMPVLSGHVRAGTLTVLGVGSPQRLKEWPDVPSIAETVPGFDVQGWFALSVAAGTPQPIVDRLNKALNAVLAEPAIVKRLLDVGAYAAPGAPDQLDQIVRRDYARWGEVINKFDIHAD